MQPVPCMSSIRSPITTRTCYNYTRSLTRIIFIARVNVKMAATRKAVEEFSPISPQRRECGTFPLLIFLEMIHISLKEGLFICRGHECPCELFIYFPKNLYTWECIEGSPFSEASRGHGEITLVVYSEYL